MSERKAIFIIYDYFHPGYKAGGPVQSLYNLIAHFSQEYSFYVLTSGYDLNAAQPYPEIILNEWNEVLIPETGQKIRVWYADKKCPGWKQAKRIFSIPSPVCYFNNIYSLNFFLIPLLTLKLTGKPARIIICPRGMLQRGALEVKKSKKLLYLNILRVSGLLKRIEWHATNDDEVADILRFIPRAKVKVASNIARPPLPVPVPTKKKPGVLRLVYLSLITEKKNLLFLLEVLQACKQQVALDIYGPVKDKEYWEKCKVWMDKLPHMVCYKGSVSPEEVQHVIAGYDAMVLLTKGENFGHALYESLGTGRPVITSYFTPWNNLKTGKAGWNVDISSKENVVLELDDIAAMTGEEFYPYCEGAHKAALLYLAGQNYQLQYTTLFE